MTSNATVSVGIPRSAEAAVFYRDDDGVACLRLPTDVPKLWSLLRLEELGHIDLTPLDQSKTSSLPSR